MKILKIFFVFALVFVCTNDMKAQRQLTANLLHEYDCMEARNCGFTMCINPRVEQDCFYVEVSMPYTVNTTVFISSDDNGEYIEFPNGGYCSTLMCFDSQAPGNVTITCGMLDENGDELCADGCIVPITGG